MILVEWTPPLISDELAECFMQLAQMISDSTQAVDIVFDIFSAGHIPVDAPTLALHSEFLSHTWTRNVAVVGLNHWAQILARMASRTSGKVISFYRSYEEAARDLRMSEESIK
jgi:hypothetical protein